MFNDDMFTAFAYAFNCKHTHESKPNKVEILESNLTFVKSKLKRDLTTYQKMTVFKFLFQLNNYEL